MKTKNANKPHFYGQLLPSDFEPFPKNPHIAQFFTQMGRSEELGTGIRKVYKYSKAYSGSEKIEFSEQDVFITKIPLGTNFQTTGFTDSFTDSFTDNTRENKIIAAIAMNNKVSTMELARQLNVTKRTIASDIALLKKKNIIQRIGSAKSGNWEIVKKTEAN